MPVSISSNVCRRLKAQLHCYAGCVCAVWKVNRDKTTIICANIVDVLLCMVAKQVAPKISVYTCGCNDRISREDNRECNFSSVDVGSILKVPPACAFDALPSRSQRDFLRCAICCVVNTYAP